MLIDNVPLILTILAGVISLLLSMYEKLVGEKKNLRLVLIASFIAFSLVTAKLVIDDIQEKNSAELKKQIETRRDIVAAEIQAKVQEGLKISLEGLEISRKTVSLLEELKPQLSGMSVSAIGVKLSGLGTEEMHLFQKGNYYELVPFVMKVETLLSDNPKALPAISLTLNANRRYIPGLIMAYTLANKGNVDDIFDSFKNGTEDWQTFPSNEFITGYGPIEPLVKYVIFFDGYENDLLGFAEASVFIKEMILYNQMGMYNQIQELLNNPGEATKLSLSRYFKSFRSETLVATDAYTAAQNMIENNINESMALYGNQYWHIELANIIELAS